MWTEPLTTRAADLSPHEFLVAVVDGDARIVASVRCAINRAAHHGMFGEMAIDRDDGAPRQTMRALALLTRAALQYAADLGIQIVETELPDERLAAFAAQLTGQEPDRSRGGRPYFRGELHAIRSRTLEETDADGNLRQRR